MESILTESNYKQVINRIALLSAIAFQSNNVCEELKNLSLLAMDYETHKYDFSLNLKYNDQTA
ncbi:hypothetical protein [Pedobacter mucosus]|uniref:hypothetical protein n=1 Tax=Pedobacter mucosus TaxID=2895286 RepID=UPI001EE3B876|nr:hypothetical protein [Pedobacter mucosus]UKT65745.1 hypothetical protein LOK61_08115 [Pedobacter mucosus]